MTLSRFARILLGEVDRGAKSLVARSTLLKTIDTSIEKAEERIIAKNKYTRYPISSGRRVEFDTTAYNRETFCEY